MAILPQGPFRAGRTLPSDSSSKQGRYPYQSWLQQWSSEDESKVMRALELTNMLNLPIAR